MQSRERGTSETYVNIAELPFPVFTICPVYPYKDERLAFHGVPGVGEIQVTYKHFKLRLYLQPVISNSGRPIGCPIIQMCHQENSSKM